MTLEQLIEQQAADDASPYQDPGHRREVQATTLESPDLPDLFDAMPDPDADTVAEAIAREQLTRWEASAGGEWIPDRPRETIGLGVINWCLETEAAALLGRPCPCCGDRPTPGRVCLGCCRGGGRLDGFLERLRRLDGDLPDGWRSIETEPERAAVLDAHDRREQSLAERRFAGRKAARASQGPPRAMPAGPSKVRMVNSAGGARMVRPSMVGAYEQTGWRVA